MSEEVAQKGNHKAVIERTMAKIEEIVPFILQWEGGYVNHPSDGGGATNKGVTMATWRGYCAKKGKPATIATLKAMTSSEWEEIFREHSWDKWKADKIVSQRVANICVDWSWMSGEGVIKRVQKIVGVKADGAVGPQTLAAINGMSEDYLFALIKQARKDYYEAIVRAKPNNAVFMKGWLNRLEAISRL